MKKLGWTGVNVLTASPGRAGLTANIGKGAVEGLYGIGSWLITPMDQLPPAGKQWADNYRKRFGIEAPEFGIGFPEFSYCYPTSGDAARTRAPFWNVFRAKGLKVI